MALSPQEQEAIDAVNGKKTATPTPKPQPGPAPLGSSIAKKIAPENPFAPLVPVLTGAARAAGTDVGKVFDVLNRPSAAHQAAMLRPGTGTKVLQHSESPEQYQADTAELGRQSTGVHLIPPILPWDVFTKASPGYGPMIRPVMTKAEYDAMPGWWHQANQILTQIRLDPTTYAGGAGILEHLTDAIGTRSFMKFVQATDAMQRSDNPAIRNAGQGLAHAYDFTHYKGATQRALAGSFGQEGVHFFRGLRAINNARRTKASDLINTLLDQYDDVRKGLSRDDEAQLYQAIHDGSVAKLPPNLSMRAAKFKQVTDSLAHLSGTEGLQKGLSEGGFELNPNLRRFESESPSIFRAQTKPGAPEFSPSRTASYFAYSPEDARNLASVAGSKGESLIGRAPSAKRPLVFEHGSEGLILPHVMQRFGMKPFADHAETIKNLPGLLKSLGVSPQRITELMKDP